MQNSNGKITDYLTEDDEIGVWIGVGELFMYLYQNLFLPNQVDLFPSRAISFPCFKNEAMYISMIETDGYVSDRAQVSLECNNLQLGQNTIDVALTESDVTTNSEGNAKQESSGWRFNFFGLVEPQTAIYTFVFNVTETCEWNPITEPASDIKGLL